MLCIDLFSGLGGFSEAFLKRGWDVIRIDNDEQFKDVPNTIIGDVHHLPLKSCKPDILIMSPPCNHLSIASVYRHWDNGIPKHNGTVMALRLVTYALDAVDYLKPRYWVLENPRGMLRTILGKPKVTTHWTSWGALYYKPTDLWGRFPKNIAWPKPRNWLKAPRGSHKGIDGSDIVPMGTAKEDKYLRVIQKGAGCGKGGRDLRPSRPALRAKIPYGLSEAFAVAIENDGEYIEEIHRNPSIFDYVRDKV